uniref:C-type lectin domain-containing protein n=1 Tax=Ciona intestinalis TaxID=7719 RepID=H2XJL4_CIOIN
NMSNKHDGCYKSINGRLGKLHYHRGQNFTDAQKHCERVDNSQLAVMKDNATIYDVVASLESYPENRKCIERDFWIGLHKENDKYKWLDGGVWDQTITPVDNSYPGNCVQLYWVRGMKPRWSQENCSSLSAFLCYTSLTDEPLSTTTVTTFSTLRKSTATAASPQSVSPVLIGAIAGGVFALLLALILVMYFCRKRKQRNQNLSPAQNPEVNMSLNFNPMYEESAQEKINPIYNMDI